MVQLVTQSPSEVQDYELDWTTALGTDVIATSAWSTSDPALVCTTPAPTNTGTTATVWISGGIVGADYVVTNIITTLAGRTMADTFGVYIQQYNFV